MPAKSRKLCCGNPALNSSINSTKCNLTNKPKRIISASRRTDIPALYTSWLLNRMDEGYVGAVNPYSRKPSIIPFNPNSISCIVFWSKNYRPFLRHLKDIQNRGFRFYCHFTITGLPDIFETNVPSVSDCIDSAMELSRKSSPQQVIWRFDPILLTNVSNIEEHISRFSMIAEKLERHVTRCITSIVTPYKKVQRHFRRVQSKHHIRFSDNTPVSNSRLIRALARIAASRHIELQTCCAPSLDRRQTQASRCIDPGLIRDLFGEAVPEPPKQAMRPACGCIQSTDIGAYNTCPHGCIYCYANYDKPSAKQNYQIHDPASAFLGYSKKQSDEWLNSQIQPARPTQMELPLE